MNLPNLSLLCAVLVGGLALSLVVAEASAGTDEAGRLFRDGRAAMKTNDYATAAEKLSESQRLDPSPGTLLNLAICEEKLGQVGRAWNHLQAVLEALSARDPRRPIAQERVDALAARVPRLTVQLHDDVPKDAVVRLDGQTVAPSQLGAPIVVDPGPHEVVLASDEGRSSRRTIQMAEGDAKKLRLGFGDEADEEANVDGQQSIHDTDAGSPTGAYILLVVGGASVATGSYLWFELNKRQDLIDTNCDAAKQCNGRGMNAVDEGKSMMPIYIGAWAVGAVGLAAGTYFLLDSDEPDEAQTRFGAAPLPGGAALGATGRF